MIRYGQKEKERREKWGKYTGKKKKKKRKTIVIGYAYLSQGKHIASDQDRLVGNQRTKERKQRHKRWKTNSENRTNQEGP